MGRKIRVNCTYSLSMLNYDERQDQSHYECLVGSTKIIQPDSNIEAFIGTHMTGKSKKEVERISFSDNKVKYFPRGLDDHFPNLREIQIYGCGLKELTREDLVGLEQVTLLGLGSNLLESLHPDLLKDMRNLKTISFYGNKLKFVSSRTFEHIKDQLTYLDLRCNTNIDAVFDPFGSRKKSVGTIEELMILIDGKCDKPEVQNEDDAKKARIAFFEHLWTSRCFSDFTIVVDNKEMKVHKAVLETQSLVFATMFEIDMEERKSGKMTIVDFSVSVVEEFLKFLYTVEIPDATNAVEFFAMAVKYDVKSLRVKMERTIADNTDEDNAIEVLKLGNLYNSSILTSKAFNELKLANPKLELADKMKNKPENIEKLIQLYIQRDQEIAVVLDRFRKLKEELTNV